MLAEKLGHADSVVDQEKLRERAFGFEFYRERSYELPSWRVYRNGRHLGTVTRDWAARFVSLRRMTAAEGGCTVHSAPFSNRRKAAEWLAGFRS